jgi:hypothetical protein
MSAFQTFRKDIFGCVIAIVAVTAAVALLMLPIRYLRNPDTTFLICSVGWNEVDDDATITLKSSSSNGRGGAQGDWVWFSAARK